MRLLGMALAALALAAASCHDDGPSEPAGRVVEPVVFATLVQTSVPGQAGPQRQEVIRDEATWRTVWSELRQGSSLPEQPPAVDFSQEMVVLAAMETQGCVARVTINAITPSPDGTFVIAVTEAPPAPNCVCITSERPIHAVRVGRIPGTPRFAVERSQTSCG